MRRQPIDPIISEVRAARDAHAARFDYDVAAIFRDIRAMQEESWARVRPLSSTPGSCS